MTNAQLCMATVVSFALILCVSCEADPAQGVPVPLPAGTFSLVDHALWEVVDEAVDPLADHRPATVTCPDGAWYLEDGALEVQSGFCTYLSLQQPVLAPVGAGDSLSLVLWHAQLGLVDAAEAHVAILFGDDVVWETTVQMPSQAVVYDQTFVAPFGLAAPRSIGFHLHNHGYNAWTFLSLEVSR